MRYLWQKLFRAMQEEETRRKAQYEELRKLENITTKAINETGITKSAILGLLVHDIKISSELSATFKAGVDPIL